MRCTEKKYKNKKQKTKKKKNGKETMSRAHVYEYLKTLMNDLSSIACSILFMSPSKKEGHIALHMSVGRSVSLNLVQLMTQERFALEEVDSPWEIQKCRLSLFVLE